MIGHRAACRLTSIAAAAVVAPLLVAVTDPARAGSAVDQGANVAAVFPAPRWAGERAPASPSTRGPRPSIDWRACGGPFACARFRVPLDHDEPDGPTISLALIKLPAARPGRRIGTLFTNPGGPGEFGVDFVRDEARSVYGKRVRDRFDIVGFDPRGVGASTPVRCFDSAAQQWRFWGAVPVFPTTPAEERAVIDANDRYAGRCAREVDPDLLAHVSTGEVAEDLDLLRRAVGDRMLTFAGYSYGSMVGLTYANLFPERVRAIVVDGVIDPVSWIGTGPVGSRVPVDVRLRSDTGSEAALRDWLRRCDAAPARCAFATADTRRRFERLMTIVGRHPIRAGAPWGVVTRDSLTSDVVHGLYGFAPWRRLAAELQQAWRHRHRVAKAEPPRAPPTPRPARGGYPNDVDAAYAVTCAETRNPASARAWVRWADRRAAVAPTFGRYWTWLDGPCASWPARSPDRYRGPFDRRAAHPLLVVNTLRDPATRYRDAVDVAQRMPGARLLTIDGTGHTSLTQDSRCADRAVTVYLVAKRLPATGLVCPTGNAPFAPARP